MIRLLMGLDIAEKKISDGGGPSCTRWFYERWVGEQLGQ